VFTCRGRIVGFSEHDGSQIVDLELGTENVEGLRTTMGTAEVVRARRIEGPAGGSATERRSRRKTQLSGWIGRTLRPNVALVSSAMAR
jgi:hypothetical protein